MEYGKCSDENILLKYQRYYSKINGGIDGYYEKTILNSEIYEVIDQSIVAYFSIHTTRGLTSLYVLEQHNASYDNIFNFVITLPLFSNILFTENDKQFLDHIQKSGIHFEIQAYNFIDTKPIVSSIEMKLTTKIDHDRIMNKYVDFIEYNDIRLGKIESFIYEVNHEIISFGAIEPLRLNKQRYCISMIVDESHRKKGLGAETVKYLVEYLQNKNLECNARCYVHNEASRKTLLKSGLMISNLLYKAEKSRE